MPGRTRLVAYVSADEAKRLKDHAAADGRTQGAALRALALEALAAREARARRRTK